MLLGAINIIYSIIGTSLLMIPTSGIIKEILLTIGLILIGISFIKAILNLISSLSGKVNVTKLCFSLSSILISIYGLTNFLK